ncbi:hypothetical protein [Streptomyces canus]|uniref:hypothetical protein n=1 Tax=Streptomyces canus TaxID=58343 RepID=UPI0027832B8F|nr:hypothetical protein [Streptomyces canus]MDQ0767214.1 hypothetical protein [Streptomyces canus]MDQ1065269.1 hypothetical protein [Streptomyces canus]
MDAVVLARVAKARARVRRHAWSLLHLRPGGFPWPAVPGKRLHDWVVTDMDATIITGTLSANLAADLDAWLRPHTLHDQQDLDDAETDTMRFWLCHLPARRAKHARRR